MTSEQLVIPHQSHKSEDIQETMPFKSHSARDCWVRMQEVDGEKLILNLLNFFPNGYEIYSVTRRKKS